MKKASKSTITIITAIIAFLIDYYFKGTIDNSIGVIILCLAVFFIVYFKLYLTIDQEDLEYKQEFYDAINHKTIKTMSQEKKPKPSSWANTDSKPAYFDNETPKEEVKPEPISEKEPIIITVDEVSVNKAVDIEKLKSLSLKERIDVIKEVNENANLEAPQRPEKDNSITETPIISKGIRSYSLHNVHQKYRGMYDDMCSFSVNNGVKPEQEVINHFRKYGYPLDIKRPEGEHVGLIAFNLGFLRIPLEGFFGVK